ncbi:hypothetical protein JOD69_004499 [Methylocaldum sp. RMAD-M]|jgi:hypothetical protein|nr:hypothetical protein [Methylocaldum sp. RMAD-M]
MVAGVVRGQPTKIRLWGSTWIDRRQISLILAGDDGHPVEWMS